MGEAISLGGLLFSVCGAVLVAWGIWRAWTRPHVDSVVNLAERRNESNALRWTLRSELASIFLRSDAPNDMSSSGAWSVDNKAGAEPVWHLTREPVSVSAAPNTNDTEPVSGATGANAIDTNARDIIRASLIAELLDSGLLTNRDKAICQAFRCSKAASTRPEAPFQIALRLVEQHRAKQRPEFISDMRERIFKEEGVA